MCRNATQRGARRSIRSIHIQHNTQLNLGGGTLAHMHTGAQPGINTALTDDIASSLTWRPPLGPIDDDDVQYSIPENVSVDELDNAFSEMEQGATVYGGLSAIDPLLDAISVRMTAQDHYDLDVLDDIDRHIAPSALVDDVHVHLGGEGHERPEWDIDALMSERGI